MQSTGGSTGYLLLLRISSSLVEFILLTVCETGEQERSMDVEWREILPAMPSSVFILVEKALCPSVRAFPRKRLRHSLPRLPVNVWRAAWPRYVVLRDYHGRCMHAPVNACAQDSDSEGPCTAGYAVGPHDDEVPVYVRTLWNSRSDNPANC